MDKNLNNNMSEVRSKKQCKLRWNEKEIIKGSVQIQPFFKKI